MVGCAAIKGGMPIFTRYLSSLDYPQSLPERRGKVAANENCYAWEAATENYEFSPRQSFPGLLAGQETQTLWGV